MDELAGTPYRLVRRLGAGAAGEVFEAVDARDGARRALKVLSIQNVGRAEVVSRMQVEARALASLRHKNLVEVMDVGALPDGRVWFAMELLEGTSLRQTIASNRRLRADVALELAIELCEGLAAAHAAGIVHRDVKPENVFVCRTGAVKLLDFGTAKVAYAPGPQTRAGFAVGTLQYMAPEQIEGKPADARTDLYAVGLVLFEMLTGRAPFADLDTVSLAFAHATRPPPTLAEALGEPAPPALEAIVARALAKSPDARFAGAAELGRALADALAALRPPSVPPAAKGMTVRIATAPPPPPGWPAPAPAPEPAPELPLRGLHPAIVALAVLAALAVLGVVVAVLRARR